MNTEENLKGRVKWERKVGPWMIKLKAAQTIGIFHHCYV